jgi:hypothetical protein
MMTTVEVMTFNFTTIGSLGCVAYSLTPAPIKQTNVDMLQERKNNIEVEYICTCKQIQKQSCIVNHMTPSQTMNLFFRSTRVHPRFLVRFVLLDL